MAEMDTTTRDLNATARMEMDVDMESMNRNDQRNTMTAAGGMVTTTTTSNNSTTPMTKPTFQQPSSIKTSSTKASTTPASPTKLSSAVEAPPLTKNEYFPIHDPTYRRHLRLHPQPPFIPKELPQGHVRVLDASENHISHIANLVSYFQGTAPGVTGYLLNHFNKDIVVKETVESLIVSWRGAVDFEKLDNGANKDSMERLFDFRVGLKDLIVLCAKKIVNEKKKHEQHESEDGNEKSHDKEEDNPEWTSAEVSMSVFHSLSNNLLFAKPKRTNYRSPTPKTSSMLLFALLKSICQFHPIYSLIALMNKRMVRRRRQVKSDILIRAKQPIVKTIPILIQTLPVLEVDVKRNVS